jgi:hypothetical protein
MINIYAIDLPRIFTLYRWLVKKMVNRRATGSRDPDVGDKELSPFISSKLRQTLSALDEQSCRSAGSNIRARDQLLAHRWRRRKKTFSRVVVHQPNRLHVGIDNGTADETKAAFLEILRKSVTLHARGRNL